MYMLEALLPGHGSEVVSAQNGEEAREKLRAGSADIIVSDILMPGKDGYQLCREVKADPALRDIPFVFMSGYPDNIVLDAKEGEGRTVTMQKPVRPMELLNVVNEIIGAPVPRS
jgi:CheY-like chemotaxis protein